MKACIIQPPYSRDVSLSDAYFDYKMNCLDQCDASADIIVLPEYSDVPCVTGTLEETLYYHRRYIDRLLEKCKETARRCGAMVFVNALSHEESGYRNTTYCYDRKGILRGKYFKKHLPPLEMETLALDSAYTMEPSSPYVLEMEGRRFGFLTCYDFYFYESFARIARENVDIIIGCSLQRSDSHEAIETMCRFLAYNTNAYVLRASVSFAEDSAICGASMAVSPEGKVLCNMRGRFGMAQAEFDPAKKYLKPAGFGAGDAPHYQYIEYGRKPWQYRPAGSFIIPDDRWLSYPRTCLSMESARTGDELLSAIGSSVALDVKEIAFDYPREALLETILRKFACHVIINIRLPHTLAPDERRRVIGLVHRYDCAKHTVFVLSRIEEVASYKAIAPEIAVCLAVQGTEPEKLVRSAIALGVEKVCFFAPNVHRDAIDHAHSYGLRCSVARADSEAAAARLRNMGADVLVIEK